MNAVYEYLNLEIRNVENINNTIQNNISAYSDTIDDMNDIESLKSLFLDFLVTSRTQANLLYNAIDDMDKFNNEILLNGRRKPDCIINPHYNNEFKKAMIETRYS